MCAILPFHLSDVDEPHKGFVDQRRCLQRMANTLVRHMPPRESPQFLVHERDQLFQRRVVATAPIDQQPRNVRPTVCVDHHGRAL
jgi:hypothetical protein